MSFKADSIFVSGLDASIGEHELHSEIFKDCGTILSVSLVYDRNGKSAGQATIRFQNTTQAQKAQKDYDGAQVDGKRMSVQLIGLLVPPKVIVKAPQPAPAPVAKKVVNKAAPAPVQQQRQQQAPRQQQQTTQRQQNVVRGAARPVAAPRQTRRQEAPRTQAPVRRAAAPQHPAQQKKAPVAQRGKPLAAAPKAKAAAPKKAPVAKAAVKAKKPVAKKVAKKPITSSDLDAQLDKYIASREAKAE